MAQRYGGQHSPGAAPKGAAGDAAKQAIAEARVVDAAGAKANILFVPPVVLALMSFGQGPVTLATGLVGAGLLTLGAWLVRDGLRARAEYDARTIARRPALPRLILAAILCGAGTGVAAWTGDAGFFGAVLYGIIASALHLAAFGIDPLADKRMEGVDTFQQDRVARVAREAEDYLGALRDHIAAIGDRSLDLRITGFLALARKMIRTVEEDPRDLTEARKFLTVYLMGARDATVKFADLYKRGADAQVRQDYETLLSDLETNFAAITDKMLQGGREDMDLEIKVLRDRLAREGVRPD
jgi:5-bromo-4-chloroindolyl phosphate hydrolysis protein